MYAIRSYYEINITAAGGAAGAQNDYETAPNSFTYDIEAQDAAGNWSVAETVTLNVTDVDDTAPVVTAGQNLYYAENQVDGGLIGFVSAMDDVAVTGFRFSDSGGGTSLDGYS